MMRTDTFQSIDLFSQASPESLEQLAGMSKRHFYKKGTMVLDHGKSQQDFLYILHGWVKLFKQSATGEEIIVDIPTQNHFCGEAFLFSPNLNESYMAQSISDLELLIIPIALLKQLIMSDHELSLSFLQSILQKQLELTEHIEHLSIQSAMQRIACFLLRLCANKQNEASVKLRLPFDKVLLAARLGMRAETFSRALGKLSQQCNLHIDSECIDIFEVRKLVGFVCQHCSRAYPCRLTEEAPAFIESIESVA